MSREVGRDVPGSEKHFARKLWADFSHRIQHMSCTFDGRGPRICFALPRYLNKNLFKMMVENASREWGTVL